MLILDLDGTLFDTSARWNECEKLANGNKRMFWDCYQSPRFMNLDKPEREVITFVQQLIDEKKPEVIAVLTSPRPEERGFPSSIRVYISHLRGSREGQRPPPIKIRDCNNVTIILITTSTLRPTMGNLPHFLPAFRT